MAKEKLPIITTDPEIDDYQGVDLDLKTLYNRFILPIERVRSFGAPTISNRPVSKDESNSSVNEVANTADYDPSSPQESRAHAFYRMIGFPVINTNGDYYNPGFDPTLQADERTKRAQIASNISPIVKRTHTLREAQVRARLAYFNFQSVDAAIFALAMGVPNGTKPFLQMNPDEGFDSNSQFDPQQYSIPIRKLFIDKRYTRSDGDPIVNYFDSGFHVIRPFNVDQNIVDTITGFTNETRQVAAPFLKAKKDTVIERNICTKRPGIEFILRLRLRQQNFGLEEIFSILESSDNSFAQDQFLASDLTINDAKSVVKIIMNSNGLSDQVIQERLNKITNLELTNLNLLTKTIKGVITLFVKAVSEITSVVDKKIKWTPMPNVKGPEFGSVSTNIIKPIKASELNTRVLLLSLRAQEAKAQGTLSNNPDIVTSDFYLSQFENTDKVFDDELQDCMNEIGNYQRLGSNSLTAIEIISGEVSGFGLIDILAIYTALWAVDINVLISMLDNVAFDRLYTNNVDLRTDDVESRRTAGPKMGILEATQMFERQVISILSYCDRIFQQKLGSPVNAEGGNTPLVRE